MKKLLTILLILACVCGFAQTGPHLLDIAGRPFVDVREYGAVGDGVTDSTTAFQAAAATGLPIVASGVFVVNGIVELESSNQGILGLGEGFFRYQN